MDLLQMILGANGGDNVRELARNANVEEAGARSAVEKLIPALLGGMQKNAKGSGGLDSLLGALKKGDHGRYLDDPKSIGREESVRDGNGILGHLFGSKDVSRKVAGRVSEQTGVGSDSIKQMLPLVAGMVMGALNKQTDGGRQAAAVSTGGGTMGLLQSMIDKDADGSVMDDLLDLGKKLF